VTPRGSGEYSFWVTKDAAIDAAPNSPIGEGQDLTLAEHAVGGVGTSMGRLFGIDRNPNPVVIFEMDPHTGEVINTLPNPAIPGGGGSGWLLATAPDGLLVTNNGANGIVEIDPDSGEVRRTLSIPNGSYHGMAYMDGQILLLEDTSESIRIFDYATGAAAGVVSVLGLGNIGGLAASDSTLYHVTYDSSSDVPGLFEIDLTTGEMTRIADTPAHQGLAVLAGRVMVFGYTVSTVVALPLADLSQPDWTFPRGPYVGGDLGGDGGSEAGPDRYRVVATAGDELRIAATALFATYGSDLDPLVELYAPDGALVASDDNSGGGVNALVTYTASESGQYEIVLRSVAGQGGYILSATGQTGVTPTFGVTATDIPSGTVLPSAPKQITVDFSGDIDVTTLDAADLTVDGVAATGVTLLDSDTAVFDLYSLKQGVRTVEIVPDAIRDVDGLGNTHFTIAFTLELTPPRVVDVSVQAGEIIRPGDLSLVIDFSQPLRTDELDATAFGLVGDWWGEIALESWSLDASNTQLTLNCSDLGDRDSYTLTLFTGDGQVEGVSGGDLDGETPLGPIGPNVSGDGIEGGDFVMRFDAYAPFEVIPSDFEPVEPYGSMIYAATVSGELPDAGVVDEYTFDLDGGQTVTLVLEAESTPHGVIELRNPTGALLAMATASGAGEPVTLQTIPGFVAGPYILRVSGAADSAGAYSVRVVLNAAVADGTGGATIAGAMDISGSFISLGGEAGRAAVIGAFPSIIAAQENFEAGALMGNWTTSSLTPSLNPRPLAVGPEELRSDPSCTGRS